MNWMLIFACGGLGSLLRHGANLFFPFTPSSFPLGTFIVNILGSFCIGAAFSISERFQISDPLLLSITAGFLGGFTTFSAFSWQSLQMIQQERWLHAATFILGCPFFGLFSAFFGWWLIRKF